MSGTWRGKRVGILYGGISRERDVSLKTGAAMAKALMQQGYDVTQIDLGEDMVNQMQQAKIDVAIIALHGTYGEDGTIQGVLECLKIPYSSAGVLGSAVAMDKVICKEVARRLDIDVAPDRLYVATREDLQTFLQGAMTFGPPWVVKPVREGSTIGITIVHERPQLEAAIHLALQSDSRVLIEAFVAGQEITVGWVSGQALTPLEIVPKSGFYDFSAKYTKGETEYILPARIDATVASHVQQSTRQLCEMLYCSGMARADFIVTPEGRSIFLELNTVPGMTETSLVPQAAAYDGMSFDVLCERILDDAALKVGGMAS